MEIKHVYQNCLHFRAALRRRFVLYSGIVRLSIAKKMQDTHHVMVEFTALVFKLAKAVNNDVATQSFCVRFA